MRQYRRHQIPRPSSRLLFPPASLANCLFAGIFRDTRGVDLCDQDRFNHFPASPLVSVSYVIHGRLHLVANGTDLASARTAAPLPQQSVTPPQNAPLTSWSTGSIAAITLGIYPDAWQKLDQAGATPQVQSALANAFSDDDQPSDPTQSWTNFTNTIAPIWQDARGIDGLADWAGSQSLADWSRSIVNRAALAGPGRSLRAFERRVRRWTHQSRQSLKFYSDMDNLHRISTLHAGAPLAGLASDAGYSDQSHMGRAVRRATGFSPADLNHRIQTSEPFWCYRLLGERF